MFMLSFTFVMLYGLFELMPIYAGFLFHLFISVLPLDFQCHMLLLIFFVFNNLR